MRDKLRLLMSLCTKTFSLFSPRWLTFFMIMMAFCIPILILNYSFWQNTELTKSMVDQWGAPVFVLIDDAINYLVLIFFLLYSVAVVKCAYAVDQGENIGIIESYRRAIRIFGSYLWVKILTLFKVLCWTLLFIIPGIIYAVFTSFSSMALMVDDHRGQEALIASRKIIQPNIGDYLFCFLIVFPVSIAICVAFILYLNTLMTYFALQANYWMTHVIGITEFVFTLMVWALFMVFFYYLYKALGGGTVGS